MQLMTCVVYVFIYLVVKMFVNTVCSLMCMLVYHLILDKQSYFLMCLCWFIYWVYSRITTYYAVCLQLQGIGRVVRIAATTTESVYGFLRSQLAGLEPLIGLCPYH
ncbi:hypothetical protein HanOQP8_Chr12g0447171 [Helianthus annuus]|nr:hypothetical protein HanOQP8_Chr12g0447171 [Helianthus annuus]